MTSAKNLYNIVRSTGYSTAKDRLEKAGFYTAHGETYNIDDIKDFIESGGKAIVSIDGKMEVLVGLTSIGELIPYRPNLDEENPVYYTDNEFIDNWNGSAILISEEERPSEVPMEHGEFIIHESHCDTWRSEDVENALSDIYRVENIERCYLPSHPVLLSFKRPSDVKLPESYDATDYNGFSDGVRITLISEENPVEYFLHELGHIFYDTMVTPVEKRKLALMWDDQKVRSHYRSIQLVGDPSKYKDPKVEVFCDLYAWYLKGEILKKGYAAILKSKCPAGYSFLRDIFERIRLEKRQEKIAELEKRNIVVTWMENQSLIKKALDRHGEQIKTIKMKIEKAKEINVGVSKIPLPGCIVPESAYIHVSSLPTNRELVQVIDGDVAGAYLILKADKTIDWKAHRKHKGNIEKAVREFQSRDPELKMVSELAKLEKSAHELLQENHEPAYIEKADPPQVEPAKESLATKLINFLTKR